MRAIVLTNSWLSGLQKGLQAGHALVEMSLESKNWGDFDNSRMNPLYKEWATEYKTLILLEGGSHQALVDFVEFLHSNEDEMSWEKFCFSSFSEDTESLNGSMTAVAMILSNEYEGYLEKYRQGNLATVWLQLTEWEKEFFAKLSGARLAS